VLNVAFRRLRIRALQRISVRHPTLSCQPTTAWAAFKSASASSLLATTSLNESWCSLMSTAMAKPSPPLGLPIPVSTVSLVLLGRGFPFGNCWEYLGPNQRRLRQAVDGLHKVQRTQEASAVSKAKQLCRRADFKTEGNKGQHSRSGLTSF
jgi:hypothetical protein